MLCGDWHVKHRFIDPGPRSLVMHIPSDALVAAGKRRVWRSRSTLQFFSNMELSDESIYSKNKGETARFP